MISFYFPDKTIQIILILKTLLAPLLPLGDVLLNHKLLQLCYPEKEKQRLMINNTILLWNNDIDP